MYVPFGWSTFCAPIIPIRMVATNKNKLLVFMVIPFHSRNNFTVHNIISIEEEEGGEPSPPPPITTIYSGISTHWCWCVCIEVSTFLIQEILLHHLQLLRSLPLLFLLLLLLEHSLFYFFCTNGFTAFYLHTRRDSL